MVPCLGAAARIAGDRITDKKQAARIIRSSVSYYNKVALSLFGSRYSDTLLGD